MFESNKDVANGTNQESRTCLFRSQVDRNHHRDSVEIRGRKSNQKINGIHRFSKNSAMNQGNNTMHTQNGTGDARRKLTVSHQQWSAKHAQYITEPIYWYFTSIDGF